MGGDKRYRKRMKNKKNHKAGHRVNDPKTFRKKQMHVAVFHSIEDDLDEIDFQ